MWRRPETDGARRGAEENRYVDVLKALEMFGGIASRRELVDAGCWEMALDFMILYRRIVRVRKGWFALPTTPTVSLAAWRVGGTLACVSALQFHELGAEAVERPLHVLVAGAASRLRNTETPPSIVHWTRRPIRGSRLAVGEELARTQARSCRQLEGTSKCLEAAAAAALP